MPIHSYSVFGLNIISELKCPELQHKKVENNDVIIEFSEVPLELREPKFKGVRFESREDEFLLKVDNVADYYVTNNKIAIQKKENADLDSVRVFLYGSVFAALLLQRSILPLHANILEKDGKAFLIAGNSGAGKSTLSTVLHKKGYNLLSDDVSVLKFENGTLKALPGIIYPKLWEKTLEHLGEEKTGLNKIRPDLNKYRYTKIDTRFNEEHEIKKMFIMNQHNIDEIKLEEIKSHAKLQQLLLHTFRKHFLFGNKIKSKQFLHFSQIADKIEIWQITRPNSINTINEIVELIESKLD
ncbi:MAG: hypothetical protein PVH88_23465 [Ignavibacteria bacterium]|jgi:hypothetical protein